MTRNHPRENNQNLAPRLLSWLWQNALLAFICGVSGALALELAIAPSYSTPFWPPAGIALAGLLLGGSRLCPGVFFGSVISSVWLLATGFPEVALLESLPVIVSIAAAMMVQAWLGLLLLRRFVGEPFELITLKKSLQFAVIALGIAAINATVGSLVSTLGDAIAENDLVFAWITWWLGDSIGIIVFVPLVLTLVASQGSTWHGYRWSVALPLVLVTATACLLTDYLTESEARRFAAQFETDAQKEAVALKNAFESYANALYPVAGLHAIRPDITLVEFNEFARDIPARFPGMRGISWVPRVSQSERQRWEAQQSAAQGRPIVITRSPGPGEFVAIADKAEYFPVTYLEPPEIATNVIGFDLSSNPSRKAALDKAAISAHPIATERIILVQESRDQYGFLLIHAVRQPGSGELTGYVTAVFRVNDMVRNALSETARGLHVALFDRSGEPGKQALCLNCLSSAAGDEKLLLDTGLLTVFPLEMGGRVWEAQFSAGAAYTAALRTTGTTLVLLAIFLFTGFLTIFLLEVASRQHEIREQVKRATLELETMNAQLINSNRELSRFAHATSHDLREPLRKIELFSGMLDSQLKLPAESRSAEALTKIRSTSHRMTGMIEKMLEYAHATGAPLNLEAVDLNETLLVTLSDLQVLIEETDASITSSELPTVEFDRTLIERVLMNLLSNALTYKHPNRKPVVEIHSAEAGEFWKITVKDNGMGFDNRHAEQIFKVFERLHGVAEPGGSGIGLATVRSIMESHSGKVTAQGSPGEGAVFTLLIRKQAR